jgi:hypothetical protein
MGMFLAGVYPGKELKDEVVALIDETGKITLLKSEADREKNYVSDVIGTVGCLK